MLAIKEVVIAGGFTILGAIINAFCVRYGFPGLKRKKSRLIECYGVGKDINLDNISDDFIKRDRFKYDIYDAKIEIENVNIRFRSMVSSMLGDGKKSLGTLNADGHFKNGYGFLIYTGNFPDENLTWKGVIVLRVAEMGDIKGYWLTQHAFSPGKFAFGDLILYRREPKNLYNNTEQEIVHDVK